MTCDDSGHSHTNECQECYELSDTDITLTSLDLNHSRIRRMQDLSSYTNLIELCMRQNMLTSMSFIENNLNLEKLDLYDNRLNHVEGLSNLSKLRVLDLAFNNIRDISPIRQLPHPTLEELYISNNLIKEIPIHVFTSTTFENLRILELGSNKILEIRGLEHLNNLQELYLGKNYIRDIEGLDSLTKLEILALPNNKIKQISGLMNLVNLKELYLSHNELESLNGDIPSCLTTLDVANNKISHICRSVSKLNNLKEFWANNNRLSIYEELEYLDKNLESIYLEGNPLQTSTAQYRTKLRLIFPDIKQIDALLTRPLSFLMQNDG